LIWEIKRMIYESSRTWCINRVEGLQVGHKAVHSSEARSSLSGHADNPSICTIASTYRRSRMSSPDNCGLLVGQRADKQSPVGLFALKGFSG